MNEVVDNLKKETKVINFVKGNDNKSYLIKGWSSPEKNNTWVDGKEAKLAFYSYYNSNDITIRIKWRSISSANEKNQKAEIELNNTKIGSFEIQSRGFQTIESSLPSAALQFGKNELQFHFSYSRKPCNFIPASKDKRDLSVAFKKIIFFRDNKMNITKKNFLLQPLGGEFTYSSELPSIFGMEIEFVSVGGAIPYITISDERDRRYTIDLTGKDKLYKQSFSVGFEEGYNISFATNCGMDGAHTIWKKILIGTP